MPNDTMTERIISSALRVHSAIGAGCLESTYHACLEYQFRVDGLRFEHQVKLPVIYQEVTLDAGYRIDFLVEDCVIVELKAVEALLPLHLAQVMTDLKLSGHHVGLLINFNVPHLRQGLRRVVNNYQEKG